MSAKKLFDPAKVEIINFSIDSFRVEAPSGFNPSAIDGFHFTSKLEIGLNLSSKSVRAVLLTDVNSVHSIDTTESAVGHFVVAFIFQVDNLGELASQGEGGTIVTHPELAHAIASLTYSTARGLLLAKCLGTPLYGAVLPVINPADLLKS